MLKKLIFVILGYIIILFPANLLEDWVMGEVLEQMEANWISGIIFWVIPLFLVLGFLKTWELITECRTKIKGKYIRASATPIIEIFDRTAAVFKKAEQIPEFEFHTHNEKGRLIEDDIAIQSVRFIKPTEKVIRPDALPAFVSCEPRRLMRLRNSLFGIPSPRIKVKKFTETGIIFDEENTEGTKVICEFYERARNEKELKKC